MRPYYIKNKGLVDGTYVRVAGTSRHAEGYMLKELILEGQNRYLIMSHVNILKLMKMT